MSVSAYETLPVFLREQGERALILGGQGNKAKFLGEQGNKDNVWEQEILDNKFSIVEQGNKPIYSRGT